MQAAVSGKYFLEKGLTIKVFHRMQDIRLLLFYSVIFHSCKFQSPLHSMQRGNKLNSKMTLKTEY